MNYSTRIGTPLALLSQKPAHSRHSKGVLCAITHPQAHASLFPAGKRAIREPFAAHYRMIMTVETGDRNTVRLSTFRLNSFTWNETRPSAAVRWGVGDVNLRSLLMYSVASEPLPLNAGPLPDVSEMTTRTGSFFEKVVWPTFVPEGPLISRPLCP